MTVVTEAIFDELADAWSCHDRDRIVALHTADCIYEDWATHPEVNGHDGLRRFLDATFETIPDFTLRFPVRFIAGNRGAAHWEIDGHWNGPFEGVDRTGHAISFYGLSSYVFRDGLFEHVIDAWDYTLMAKAFGVIPRSIAGFSTA